MPAPDFSVGLPPFSCANAATPFQNNSPPLTDSNIVTWSWKFGDTAASTSAQQNPSFIYPVSGNFSVTLTATSDVACPGTITKSILIAPSPTADFTSTATCLNTPTQFTDLSSGGVQTRLWQIGSASFGTTNPAYTFTAPGASTAILSVTGANLCTNVKIKTITVPVPPIQNFTITNPCAAQDAIFSDITSSPQDVVVGWNWNFAGNSSTGNPANFAFDAGGTYNVKLTTTHLSGCRYTLSKNVLINNSPVASFTASPDRGAAPLIVQFTNTSQQATSYTWKFYDNVVATSTAVSPGHTFTLLGDYLTELTATNSLGCSNVFTVPIKVLVPALDLILTDFSLTPDPTTGNLKGVVTIRNNSNVPITSAVVAIYLSDKAVVNETVPLNLSPGQSATRTLSFTLSPAQFDLNFLCAGIILEKDQQQDNNKRCINLEATDYYFSPYPNPTTGTLHVDWVAQKAGTARILVYDNLGRKSYEWETPQQIGLNQGVLDLTFLTAGMYYVSIETGAGKKTSRFLRQ